MPEETKETQETLEAIKAQLEQEQALHTQAKALLAEKDARVAELEASLSEAKQGSEAASAEKVSLSDALATAVAKYLDVVKAVNPTIPGDVITGDTIEDIDASVAKALSIASAVKASLEAQAKETKVPAGAPTRGEISLEGLTPREKIATGIQQSRAPTA